MPTPTEMLSAYQEAEAAILAGKEFTWSDGSRLRHEDLPEIRKGRQEWEAKVASAAARSAGQPTIGGLSFAVADLSGGHR